MGKYIYHGSSRVIQAPEWGVGNMKNDYGLGFYCTEDCDLAKEWASSGDRDGYSNKYEIDLEGLNICDMTGGHHILNWMAVLLDNRTFHLTSSLAVAAREYILDHFTPDYRYDDVVIGYRADDSYFSFAKDFLNNSISLQTLSRAMKLGRLGEQVVIRTQRGMERLKFIAAEYVDSSLYYPLKLSRDATAREEYFKSRTEDNPLDAVYVLDIMREKWEDSYERLQ